MRIEAAASRHVDVQNLCPWPAMSLLCSILGRAALIQPRPKSRRRCRRRNLSSDTNPGIGWSWSLKFLIRSGCRARRTRASVSGVYLSHGVLARVCPAALRPPPLHEKR